MEKNEIARTVAVGLLGVGIGYGVGYYTSRKRHEAIADTAIEEVKERYHELYSDVSLAKEAEPNRVVIQESELQEEVSEEPEVVRYANIKPAPSVVQRGTRPPLSSEMENGKRVADAIFGLDASDAPAEPGPVQVNVFEVQVNGAQPYLISEDMYEEDWEAFAKIELTYYADDNVLVEDRTNDPITSIQSVVGLETLEKFGTGTENKDAVYVRNEKMQTDWAITRVHESFAVVILGQPPK